MRLIKWVPMLILILVFCSACSSNIVEEAEYVRLNFWEGEDTKKMSEEYLDENTGLTIFIDAVNTAKELEKQNVITTKPFLSMEFIKTTEEREKYHLWITDEGEGYIQSLDPNEVTTSRINSDSVSRLKEFFTKENNFKILNGEIEFEN